MLDTAIKIATKSFYGKFDKAGKPYIEHCKRVMESIINAHPKIGDEIKCIAILHDVLEDCPEWNEKTLGYFFNDRIISGIVSLTHKKDQSYDEYISQILQNSDAILVKIHDLKDNMDVTRLESLSENDLQRLKKYHNAFRRLSE